MAHFSIRDLENISGIKAHTLRMWEQRYEILRPKRTDTNIRFYGEDDLRLLLSISMLNNNGYKISQIAKMSHDDIHRSCQSIHDSSEEFANQINTLVLSMIELDEERFDRTIASCTLKLGFEEAMIRIVYPFFERVGVLWQTGSVRPAQEHFISNLVRQKVIVAIDAQEKHVDAKAPRFLLYLPEHEMHELSLLFASYVLRSRGNKVIYLGQNVPDEDLTSVLETYLPDCLVTIITIASAKESCEEYLARIGTRFPKTKILVSGLACMSVKSVPSNVQILPRMQDLLHYAEQTTKAS